MNKDKAFTLTELMVVVILIGIIAAFALPNYNKAIAKAHERDAIVQLMAIHAACKIYNAQAGQYPQEALDIDGINEQLGLNVIANGMTYAYALKLPDQFNVTAQWKESGHDDYFEISINEHPINQHEAKDLNPCCSSGDKPCPSLGQCP